MKAARHQWLFSRTGGGILPAMERGFLILGIALLTYTVCCIGYAKVFQIIAARSLDRQLSADIPPTIQHSADSHSGSLAALAAKDGSPFCKVEINRLGLSVMVAEGEDEATLRKAVGHIPGTPFPGQAGNVGLAGHRDAFFRPLKDVRLNDEISLTTLDGVYRYRVDSFEVVKPSDVAVLNPRGGQSLTLVTCYPFHFVGAAPLRFIVHARRVEG